jgi:acetoin utilization protein AcuB
MLTARELMTENPVTVPATARVRQAVQLLQTLDIRHLPVVGEDGELIGMLSDRDLRSLSVPYLVADEYVGNISAARDMAVASLMTGDVLSVTPDADASDIVELMLDFKIGAVPVTESDGTLVGIVSYVDLLRQIPFESEAAQ